MFGVFEGPHTSIGWSGGAGGGSFVGPGGGGSYGGPGGAIPAGGFPGIFPGGGVSNSGFAGFTKNYKEWKKDCAKKGECVMGPPPSLMGPRRI